MQNVVSFYERLPRGSAPEPKPRGLLGRYAARYMGKNPSPMRKLEHDARRLLGGLRLTEMDSTGTPNCGDDTLRLCAELLFPSA